MTGESLTIVQDQLEKLKQLFPETISEGKIDWEKLQATLGKENIEFSNERYVLNWAGKSEAFKVLQQSTTATLKPVPEESINFANPPLIHFGEDETTIPCRKSYLKDIDTEPFSSVFYRDGRFATLQVEELVGKGVFSFPKNTEVIQDLQSWL